MTTRLSNQMLQASTLLAVLGIACLGALDGAFPGFAHGAEREICEKITGEQLRRCIEDAARAPSPSQNTGTPVRPPSAPAPTAGGAAVILPPDPGKVASSAPPTSSRILNCTKVSYVDQSFCATRNSALLECGNRTKYPDPDRCFNDVMSRTTPDLNTVDCSKVPDAHKPGCNQRNKVYALCKNDKMNYFACLETKMGMQK